VKGWVVVYPMPPRPAHRLDRQVAGAPVPNGGHCKRSTTPPMLSLIEVVSLAIEPERSISTYRSRFWTRVWKSRSSSVGVCAPMYGSMKTKSPLACGLSLASLASVPAASSIRSLTPSPSVSPVVADDSAPSRTPLQLASSAPSVRPSSSLSRSLKSGRVSPSVSRGGIAPPDSS
jgi:hypothetical protein